MSNASRRVVGPSSTETVKAFIFTLCFLLTAGPAWAVCAMKSLFSPFDKIDEAIHTKLTEATTSIHCSLYGITRERLANDLIDAKNRGAEVGVGLDKLHSTNKSSKHALLEDAGILVVIKRTGVFEHNKFCVIDGAIVIMGSWNWSNSAQKQDNSNVIFNNCPKVTAAFEAAYKRIIDRDRVE